jgi:predicted RNA-binding Zn ribbon-like protein
MLELPILTCQVEFDGYKLNLMTQGSAKSRFEFTGGKLCLDFANTVNNRTSDNPEELLTDYSSLVKWGEEAGVLTPKNLERLHQLAGEAPGHAQSALRYSIQLRDAIYAVFDAVAGRRAVPGGALTMINAAVQQASEHVRIVHGNRRFDWEWVLPESSLDSMLWPVARSAADLLTSDDLEYVRECAAGDCGWLFLDKTKNHRRRWCEMKTCGNRDKARRYYARKKA